MVVADAWRWGAVDGATLEQLAPRCRCCSCLDRSAGRPSSASSAIPARTSTVSPTRVGRTRGTASRSPAARCRTRRSRSSKSRDTPTQPCSPPPTSPPSYPVPRCTPTTCASARRRYAIGSTNSSGIPRGWFVLGLDGSGRPIDALTTNPGHALWCGIADPGLADQYLDRLLEQELWSGWGLRTLARSMGAYDPLSYHNGSVWPHDTAICAAGAARYGRWDVVDQLRRRRARRLRTSWRRTSDAGWSGRSEASGVIWARRFSISRMSAPRCPIENVRAQMIG